MRIYAPKRAGGAGYMENILIVGVTLLLLGAILLVWRFYHMWFLGEFWNNMPTLITWGFTSLMVGAALYLVLVIFISEECPDKCNKTGIDYVGGIVLGASICMAIGAVSMCRKRCHCDADESENPPRWNWGDDKKGIAPMDERPSASGIDVLFFTMGIAIIVSNLRLGTCPVSCGVAVVAAPPAPVH